jgi:alkylation response protein AidB-like acyl-CoA dehydrogenase
MNDLNDSEVELIRDTIRRILADMVRPGDAGRWDAESLYPAEVLARIQEAGLCGLTIPEAYGGAGINIPAALAVVEELSKCSLAIAVPYIMSAFYGGMNIDECGSEEQKRELLPRLALGELKFAFAVTEPDVGADVASVRTTARIEVDAIVVNGSKRFITGANVADYLYTIVRSGDVNDRYKNLTILLIPRETQGVSIEKIESIGMRGGAYTTDIVFDDVRLPKSCIVGGESGWNRGWPMMAGPGLDVERLEVAATALGLATAALNEAWEYSQTRTQFGVPVCTHQSVRHTLADAQTELMACRLLLTHAARAAQERRPCRTESAMAKLFICERAKKIILDCQMIFGAYGCVREYNMERYVRDILILPIAGGSSAIQRNNIAASMGLPRK